MRVKYEIDLKSTEISRSESTETVASSASTIPYALPYADEPYFIRAAASRTSTVTIGSSDNSDDSDDEIEILQTHHIPRNVNPYTSEEPNELVEISVNTPAVDDPERFPETNQETNNAHNNALPEQLESV